MTIHWKTVEQYFTVAKFVNLKILSNLSILDLALSGVKGLNSMQFGSHYIFLVITLPYIAITL